MVRDARRSRQRTTEVIDPATFWELVNGAVRLRPEAFARIEESAGFGVALPIVFVAGVSQAIGQSVVLFVNRVRPARFVFSLAIAALLFVVVYALFTLSVVLVIRNLFGGELTFPSAARIVGVGFAPRMLAFLAFVPFFGIQIDVLLSLWALLTVLTGIALVEGIAPWQALLAALLGGLLLVVVQRIVGRPLAVVTNWLQRSIAGRRLVIEPAEIEELIEAGPEALEAAVTEDLDRADPDEGASPGERSSP